MSRILHKKNSQLVLKIYEFPSLIANGNPPDFKYLSSALIALTFSTAVKEGPLCISVF